MDFEWDDDKAASNFEKHRVSFDEALGVFADPLRVELVDERDYDGEERWNAVGLATAWSLPSVTRTGEKRYD